MREKKRATIKPFARALLLFLTIGSFHFIVNQTLSGLNSCLIAVKQTANIYLTVKLEYHFQSVWLRSKPRLPEAIHKNERELVRTKNLSLESGGFIPLKGNS